MLGLCQYPHFCTWRAFRELVTLDGYSIQLIKDLLTRNWKKVRISCYFVRVEFLQKNLLSTTEMALSADMTELVKPFEKEHWSSHTSKIGVLHIICGLLALGAQIGLYCTSGDSLSNKIGTGIWTSVFFFLSGGFSLLVSKRLSKGSVVALLVAKTLSSTSAGFLIVLSLLCLGLDTDHCADLFCYIHIVAGVIELLLSTVTSTLSWNTTSRCVEDVEVKVWGFSIGGKQENKIEEVNSNEAGIKCENVDGGSGSVDV